MARSFLFEAPLFCFTFTFPSQLYEILLMNGEQGVWPDDTNHIVVPQTEEEHGHYTLFSGNHETGSGGDNAVW